MGRWRLFKVAVTLAFLLVPLWAAAADSGVAADGGVAANDGVAADDEVSADDGVAADSGVADNDEVAADDEAEAEAVEPALEEPIQVAVLDVLGSGPVDPSQVEGLSGVLAAQVSGRPGLTVTTSSDIRQVLGFEAERQLLGCDDTACFAEIGGALGVDYLIAAEVSKVGASWLLNVGLVDLERARTVHRVSHRTREEEELIDLLIEATAEILVHLGVEAAPAARVSSIAEPVSGRRSVGPYVGMAAGSLAVVGGGILYGGAWATYSAHQAGQPIDEVPTVTRSEADAARRNAALGVGLLAGGAAVTAASFLLPRMMDRGPALAVVPVDDGGLLLVAFSLEAP